MNISESHKQLLVTMLNYEIMNFVDPAIDRAKVNYSLKEEDRLITIRKYMQDRIDLYSK